MAMKKILIPLLCGLLLIACFDDENIHADYVEYGRAYDTTSSDPVLKYISQYYYKYGKILITDPDTADYMFNFQMKNKVRMVEPRQDQEHLVEALTFLKELFLNGYNDQVKKELFPYAIIMADSIYDWGNEKYVNMYTASSYVAFLVNDEMLNKNEEEKVELSMEWNNTFLNYCMDKIGWTVPEEFYLYSNEEYGKRENWWIPSEGATEKDTADINIVWEKGYPKGKWDWQYSGSEKEWGYSLASSREGYLEQFFDFLFTTPQETIDQAIADHEKLRKAHDVLDQALKEDFGIDYRTMIYKAEK